MNSFITNRAACFVCGNKNSICIKKIDPSGPVISGSVTSSGGEGGGILNCFSGIKGAGSKATQ